MHAAARIWKPDTISQCSKQRSTTVGLQDDQVRAMMNDPAAMQAMHDVMSQLSPEDLVAMSRHSGVDLTEEQVAQEEDRDLVY